MRGATKTWRLFQNRASTDQQQSKSTLNLAESKRISDTPRLCDGVPARAAAGRQLRVAFLSYDFGEYSIQHANGLLRDGEVMLIIPQQLAGPHLSILDPHIDFRPFNKPRLRQPLRQLACIRWIFKQIREFQPDVIHFQRGHLWFNLVMPFLKRYSLVMTIHDPRHHAGDRGSQKTPQFIMDFGYRQADRIIVHGTQLKEIVATEIGIPDNKIHVIPHIAIGERNTTKVAETDEQLILFFGRIWLYKGLDYLIRAQSLINREFPDARIMICGQGENFQRYRKLMSDPDKFIVHNRWITDDERTEFFQRASIVVLPYIEATQSGVVPVAYAHSKPVIATRTGGLPDVIEDGRTGLLVAPKDEAQLGAAIVRLLGDKHLRESMGRAGKRKLETELSTAAVTKQTADVYRAAIEDVSSKKRTQQSIKKSDSVSNARP